MAQACRQGVAPQLFRSLVAKAAVHPVPRGAIQCIWLGATRQREAAGRLERELPTVLRHLRASGVSPILLKGAHLAPLVYPEPALRPMDDFDLLVHRADLATAEQALLAEGYQTGRTESIDDACAREHSLPTLFKPERVPIELHWTISTPADHFGVAVDLDGIWQRAQPVTVYGEPASVLAPEDALLHICVHAAIHHLFDQGIRPLLDLAALLDRHGSTIDWAVVVDRAHAWDVSRAVYLLLDLASHDVGAVVPGHVLAALQPTGVPSEVRQAARAQLLELPFLGDVSTRAVAQAWARPRFVWESVFTANTTLAREYGPRPQPVQLANYYLRRVGDLARRYGRAAWRLARQDRGQLAATTERIQREVVLRAWLEQGRS